MADENTPAPAHEPDPAAMAQVIDESSHGAPADTVETARALADDTPGIDEFLAEVDNQARGIPEAEEGAPQPAEEQAAEQTGEAPATAPEEPPLSADLQQTLLQQYGQDEVTRINADPALRRQVTRAVTAARQKDRAELEQARVLRDVMSQLPPDVIAQIVSGRQNPPQGAPPQAQPPAEDPFTVNGKPYDDWGQAELGVFLKERLPQMLAVAEQRAVQAAMAQVRPADVIAGEQYADRQMAKLTERGYTSDVIASHRNRIWNDAVALSKVPGNYDGKNDTELWERAMWGIPEIRDSVVNARAAATKTVEATRQERAQREASVPRSQRPTAPAAFDARKTYDQLSKMNDQGIRTDALVVQADPSWGAEA